MSREYSEYNIKRFCAGGPKYYIVFRKYLMFLYFRQYAICFTSKKENDEKCVIKLRGKISILRNKI